MKTATQSAPAATQTAGQFIKKVRRYTRRKYTAEDKIRILTLTQLSNAKDIPTFLEL